MDPQQRILLHAAQEAFEDAGYVGDSTPCSQRATTGCYIGLATGDYADNLRNDIDVFYSPGTLRAFNSGRISYFYSLSGPSIVTDTACSSSMVSIYQACRALQCGDCATAIAGGVNVISSPDVGGFLAESFETEMQLLTFARCTLVWPEAIFSVQLEAANPSMQLLTDIAGLRALFSLFSSDYLMLSRKTTAYTESSGTSRSIKAAMLNPSRILTVERKLTCSSDCSIKQMSIPDLLVS